jgi:hypothetical protein
MRRGLQDTHWYGTATPVWQGAICALLAVLLLYNPFIVLYCSHGPNSVHTRERNRATVGASELQQFGPIQKETQQLDLSLQENRDEVAAPVASFVARGFERQEEVPQPEFSGKVWSRPPPTL